MKETPLILYCSNALRDGSPPLTMCVLYVSFTANWLFQGPLSARESSQVDETRRSQSLPPSSPPRPSPTCRNLPVSTAANLQMAAASARPTVTPNPSEAPSSNVGNQHPAVPRSANNQMPIENQPSCSTAYRASPPPRQVQVSTTSVQQPLQPLSIRFNNQRVQLQPGGNDGVGDETNGSDGPLKRRRGGTTTRGRSKRGRGGH